MSKPGHRQAHHLDPAPYVERISELVAAGNSISELAIAIGMTRQALMVLARGDRVGIRPTTAEAIMAIPLEAVGQHELAEPTARRLQALTAIGYSSRALSAHITTTTRDNLRVVVIGDRLRVTRRFADEVRDVYQQLKDTPNESDGRTSKYARGKGWMPPQAWEGHDIDDPEPTLTMRVAAQWAATPKTLSKPEQLRQAREDHDYTRQELADKVGVDIKTYGKYENGIKVPGRVVAQKLHKLIGWS